jgi:hypothetical protein
MAQKRKSASRPGGKSKKKLAYDVYIREREHLSRYETDNYENYQKTILTLSSAFLAFSVSLLALLRDNQASNLAALPPLQAHYLLILAWTSFAGSVLLTLLSFLLGAVSLRTEVAKLELALDDTSNLEGANYWDYATYALYVLAGVAFAIGLVFLLTFAGINAAGF